MQIINFNRDIYSYILPNTSLKDTLNLSATCKTINTLFSNSNFAPYISDCKKVFTFCKQFPHYINLTNFKVNLMGSILYDKDYFDEKMQFLVNTSPLLKDAVPGRKVVKKNEEQKRVFFNQENLFLFLESYDFSLKFSEMSCKKYLETGDRNHISQLCSKVTDMMKSPFHKEAVGKIFHKVFDLTLEKEMEKLKETLSKNPQLLDSFKEDIKKFKNPQFNAFSSLNKHLWEDLLLIWKTLDSLDKFISKDPNKPEMIKNSMSSEKVQNQLNEIIISLEQKK